MAKPTIGDVAWVKPKDGHRVKCPKSLEVLPVGGKRVRLTQYWLRRAAESVVRITSGPPAVAKRSKPATLNKDLPDPEAA